MAEIWAEICRNLPAEIRDSFCIFPQPRNDSRLKDILTVDGFTLTAAHLVKDYAADSSLDYQCETFVRREGATSVVSLLVRAEC